MLRRIGGTRSIDWTTFSIYLGMVVLGWLMIYAVTEPEIAKYGFLNSTAGKQAIWIGISFTAMGFIYAIDWKFWQTFAYPIYAISLALLVGVLFLGSEIKGATSWYAFGGFSFQPSELAKFGTALALSSFLSWYKTNLKNLRSQLIAFALFFTPAALILLQPDAGSAMVFFSFLIVLYREGLNPTYYLVGAFLAAMLLTGLVFNPMDIWIVLLLLALGMLAYQHQPRRYWMGGIGILALAAYFLAPLGWQTEILIAFSATFVLWAIFYWSRKGLKLVGPLVTALVIGMVFSYAANYGFNNFLKPHQQDRINVWLNPEKCDPRGSLYNLMQSKMAISSGGFQGKGFLQGNMTKLNYVPEQSTDFIFCTIGEEQGFIGSFAIIALFLILILRLTIIAERQRSNFSRVYAYCLAGIFFVHFFINIGMTMGLVPIIGIPLPFISKGGSGLLGFTIMIGVLLKLDSRRYNI